MSDDLRILEALVLENILLEECSIVRGEATDRSPGTADVHARISPREDTPPGTVAYDVGLTCHLTNTADETLAQIEIVHCARYEVLDGFEVTDEALSFYGRHAVVFQVHPYMREMLSSLTGKMGLPPYFLDVLHHDQASGDSE